MATLGSVEIAVKIALETLAPQIARLEAELAKVKDVKVGVSVLDSRDSVKNLKADLLEAQAIGKKGIFGSSTKEGAELQKQAALLREQVRFRQQLAQIKTFSPKEAQQARAIAKEINSINVARINSEFAKTGGLLNDLRQKAAGFGDNITQGIGQGIGQSVAGVGGAIAAAPFKVAGAAIGGLVGILGNAAKEYVTLEEQIVSAGVATNALGTPAFEGLKKEIKRLGIETSKAPAEIAETAVNLARAGFTADQTAASLEGIARASEATAEDIQVVGGIIGNTYRVLERQFVASGQSIDQSSKFIANALVQTANATDTSISGLGESISEVGPAAAATGQPLNDILVALGLLGDAGTRGSEAGTALRAALDKLAITSALSTTELQGLAEGSGPAVAALSAIGAEVRDSEGNLLPLLEILPKLRAGVNDLSKGDQAVVLNALFGETGGKAINSLLAFTPDRVKAVTNEVKVLAQEGVGAAVKAGEAQLQGLQGGLKLIGGSIQTLNANIGEAIAPALSASVNFANELFVSLIENEGIFEGINEQAIAFQDYLKDNPEILESTKNALGEVVTTLATEASLAAQDFLQFLKDNPRAIQDAVNSFKEMVTVLGQAVKLMADLVGGAVKVAQGIGATFGKGGAAGAGAAAIAQNVPGVDNAELQRRIEARRQAEVIQPEQGFFSRAKGVAAFGISPIAGVLGQGRRISKGRDLTAKIVEEETARAIDEAAARNRAQQRAATAPLEQAGPLRPGEERGKIDREQLKALADEAKATQAVQKTANEEVAKAQAGPKPKKVSATEIGKAEIEAIDKAAAERDQAIKRSVIRGQLTTEQAEQQRSKAESVLGARRIAALQKALREISTLRSQGLISEKDAATRSSQIQEQLTKEQGAQLDRQIAAQKAARDEQIKILEDQAAAAEQAIADRQAKGSIAIKRQVLSGGLDTGGAERAQLEVEQRAGQERIAALQQQQARVQQLRDQGVFDAEEAGDRLAQIQSQITAETSAQLDRQIEAQRKAREAQVKVFEEATKAEERAFQNTQRARANALKEGRLRGEAPEAIALKEVENQSRATLEEIDLVRDQLAGIESLRGRGALTAEDAANRQIDLQNKLGDLSTRILDNELAKREAIAGVIQRNGQLQQQVSDLAISQLEAQSKGLGQVSEALELNNQLLASRQGVLSASSDAAVTAAQSELSALQQADEIRKRLGEEGVGSAEKQVIGQRLGQLGVGAAASDADTLQARQAAEDKLAQAEVQRLLTQQNIERQNLDLQAQSNKIRAEALLLEKQIEQAKAQQAIAQAQFNLEAAKAKGDPREVALAQAQVTLAEQQAGFAAQAVSLAQQNALVQAEVANNERTALGITQQAALQEQLRADQSREFLQAQERAKLVDTGATGLSTTIDQSAAQRQLQGALAQTGGAPAAAFTTPQIQAEQFRAANAGVEAKLDEVKAVLSQALAVPRNITVSTPQPVQDAAKILADASRLRLQ